MESLCSHLLSFGLIKNIDPIPMCHYHSWQRALLGRGIRNTKYPHPAAEIFKSSYPDLKIAGSGTDFQIFILSGQIFR